MEQQSTSTPEVSAITADQYLVTRIDDQINWYNRKSGLLKRRYRQIKVLTILLGGLIPLCIAFSEKVWEPFKYVAGIFGALISIFEGVSGMLKDKETYLSYRAANEALVREKMQYQSRVGKYGDPNTAFAILVESCEAIMAGENSQWVSNQLTEKQTG